MLPVKPFTYVSSCSVSPYSYTKGNTDRRGAAAAASGRCWHKLYVEERHFNVILSFDGGGNG